jgi:hypothetical protein
LEIAKFPVDDKAVYQALGQLIVGIVNLTVTLPDRANQHTIKKVIIPQGIAYICGLSSQVDPRKLASSFMD